MEKQKTRFSHEIVPLRGAFAGQVLLVSERQKKRLLLQKRARLPRKDEKGTGVIKPKIGIRVKTEKEAEQRQDK